MYTALLNVAAPLIGGAFVLEVLAELSPSLRMMLCLRADRYYFSELNDNSLSLAKELAGPGILLIFTDVSRDGVNSELVSQAKGLGAVCLKEDLLSIPSPDLSSSKTKLFLIDTSETANLEALTSLLSSLKSSSPKTSGADTRGKTGSAEIYVFSTDREYSNLDEEIAFIVNRLFDGEDASRAPRIIPVNGIRNMVLKLFTDVPLFEPLIGSQDPGKGEDKQLNLTIIGSGSIGTEAFLNAYWCGQMLGCRLHITVISKEKRNAHSSFPGEGDFEGRINSINPEIFMTADPSSPLLKYNKKNGTNPPYFSYDYIEADVLSGELDSGVCCEAVSDTDYFIVAIGTDELNFELADKLRRAVGARHLYDDGHRNTVISYAVYSSELSRALNKEKRHKYRPSEGACDVYMHAFGCLDEVYSRKTVMLGGWQINEYSDIYSVQSDSARRIHRRYAEYSAGFHTESFFTSANDGIFTLPAEEYLVFVKNPEAEPPRGGTGRQSMLNDLAWLEHRRWNAYMRSRGFRNPRDKFGKGFEQYCNLTGLTDHPEKSHKYISLRLHPCLVECDKLGMSESIDELKNNPEANDPLDMVSLERYGLIYDPDGLADPPSDFKKFDKPSEGISEEEETTARLLVEWRKKLDQVLELRYFFVAKKCSAHTFPFDGAPVADKLVKNDICLLLAGEQKGSESKDDKRWVRIKNVTSGIISYIDESYIGETVTGSSLAQPEFCPGSPSSAKDRTVEVILRDAAPRGCIYVAEFSYHNGSGQKSTNTVSFTGNRVSDRIGADCVCTVGVSLKVNDSTLDVESSQVRSGEIVVKE